MNNNTLLSVNNIYASVEDKQILNGLNLEIKKGEVHAIMGPNGSGKSTLSSVIAGDPRFNVTKGEIQFQGKDMLEMSPEQRAKEGLFLSFQYPVEIPGVNTMQFVKTAINEKRKYRGEDPLKAVDLVKYMKDKKEQVKIDTKLTNRSLNEGFSGGEKKKNEIFQMLLLEPSLAILDETDSGLDIDALQTIADGVNAYRSSENGLLVITHYQRLLDYIVPDFVHILYQGKIIKVAGKELALELEEKGYEWIKESNS